VFTLSELEALGAFATKHDLVVFSDEMYEHFLYDEVQHIPALSVSSLKERTVQISGFSKVFSVTGWRIGYAIASKEIIAAMANYNDLIYVCAPAPLQIGVSEGLKQLDDSYYIDLAKVHQEKRDLFCTALEEVGLNPSVPKGAYYVMCDVSSVEGSDDKAKALHILKTTGVASVAGRAFYHDASGSNMVRFCYSKPIDVLKEAAQQIRKLG
jgi:aminotransferase